MIINFVLGIFILGLFLRGNVVFKILFATSAPEEMLEAARNFRQTAFHTIGCVDKHMTETMNEMEDYAML